MKKTIILFYLLTHSLYAEIFDFGTLKANFIQTITNDQNSTITYKGTLFIMKPDKIVWQYNTPIEKYIYMNGDEVTVYEPELYQAIVMKRQKELDPMKMYRESKEITKTRRVSYFDGKEIIIEHDDKGVKSLHFTDKIDNQVTIRFLTYEKNLSIKNETFTFKPTDDIDIIRE